ncbi:kinase domain-containing protein [Fusarium avenaceum]|nr:kinase domain-containing protein [Fusarium avenaceum]
MDRASLPSADLPSCHTVPLSDAESTHNSDNFNDWGDFVDSEDEFDIEAVSEDVNLYPTGMCYPIRIGEAVAGRYRIIHKLGYGSFSTVWMAYDMTEEKDVALKILMLGDSEDREYHMQREIVRAVQDTTYLVVYRSTFLLDSPHGRHRVLVFPLLGPNLRDHPPKEPPATRMSFAVQLLQALKNLHDGEIVYGDLNRANILYSLRALDNCSITEKYAQVGRPRKMRLFTEQWKDGELVMPMKPQESLLGDTIRLGDFGLAVKAGTPVAQKLQLPATYCAPERLHDRNPSYASDMWSYMCLFFELYAKRCLFPGFSHALVTERMVSMLGPLPLSWVGSYHASGQNDLAWYDQDRHPDPEMALRTDIRSFRPDISARELELVLSVLSWGLSYLPEHRPTATQLLEDLSWKELTGLYGL